VRFLRCHGERRIRRMRLPGAGSSGASGTCDEDRPRCETMPSIVGISPADGVACGPLSTLVTRGAATCRSPRPGPLLSHEDGVASQVALSQRLTGPAMPPSPLVSAVRVKMASWLPMRHHRKPSEKGWLRPWTRFLPKSA
jgi:hypothetical protein